MKRQWDVQPEMNFWKHPKVVRLLQSRKAWAGTLGLVLTLGLWALGEIGAAQAVEAMTWVLGIFIGAVALEDGLGRLLHSLAGAVTSAQMAAVRVEARAEKYEGKDEEKHDDAAE